MAAVNSTTSNTTNTTDTTNNAKKADDANATKTLRGTRIVKKGQEMDENAFFKILAAELSNQDPTNAKDGTEYVSQMAQFSALQQMVNLNSSMKFTGASSLIGKTVTLKKLDVKGNFYSGLVTNVIKNGDTIQLNVVVGKEKDENGNLVDKSQKFDFDDVNSINNYNNSEEANGEFLSASALIGRTVELDEKDSNNKNYAGVVEGASKDTDGIKVTVNIGNNQTKDFLYSNIITVK